MLIDRPLSPGDIATMKLVTGEEVIAKVVNMDNNVATINKPLILMLVQQHSGHGMVGMAPFMLGLADDGNIRIDQSKIVAIGKARDDAKRQYVQSTTGLAMAGVMPDLNSSNKN